MEKELNDLLEYEEPKNMDLKARQERINSYLQNWDNIRLKDVKQSELMDNDVIYVLTKDGKLYCDGNFIRDDIEELWCFDTYYIFLITKDKQIHTLQDSPFNKYFGNIQFKKIVTSQYGELLAITPDNKLKAMSYMKFFFAIDPENYYDVEDILIEGEDETPYIIKNGDKIPLYIEVN